MFNMFKTATFRWSDKHPGSQNYIWSGNTRKIIALKRNSEDH